MPRLAQPGAGFGGAPVLPDDGAVDGFAGVPVPKDRGFPRIGDAHTQAIGRSHTRPLDCLRHGIADALPNLVEIVLDPAWPWEMLRKLMVRSP